MTPPDWPCLPSLRAARLGQSSAVACAHLDAVARVVLQGTCHVPPHPRRAPQLIAEKGPWATRQCGGPAPCERGRADRLSDVSRLARAAAPHSAYRYAALGRQRLLSTCIDNGARILYICVDTCRHADPADGARGHVTHPDHDPPDRLSGAEEAAMIDLAAYVLEPLHQDGACLLSRGQLRGRRAGMVPSLLVVAPVGDHPAPASLQRLEHEYALRAALDPAWEIGRASC